MPALNGYGFDRLPDADNAAVGKYSVCIAAGLLPAAFLFCISELIAIYFKEKNKMKENRKKPIHRISECAIFIAMAVGLSYCEIELGGFGGDISFCMVPLFIICYRHGAFYGVLSGLTFGFLKCLLGGGIGWGLPSILLDYVLAYGAVGVAGVFKKKRAFLEVSVLLGAFARFIIHFISGITIYKIAVPTEVQGFEAFGAIASPTLFSLVYNLAYMLPSTVICVVIIALLRVPLKKMDKI